MNRAIRILLADDSTVVRRLLKEVLEQTGKIEVVKQAKNGADAVEQFSTVQPDVVLLDVEMPVMNGIEAAAAINAIDSDVPIIMFSSTTTRGAETTLDAMSCGACDYETKPSMVGHLSKAKSTILERLAPKIISWGKRRRASQSPRVVEQECEARIPSSTFETSTNTTPFDVVCVGVSTGGPLALKEFLLAFPADFGVPIVVVQHMPPVFTKTMADRLDGISELHVAEARAGSVLTPGTAWIAPGDFHMEVVRQGTQVVARLNQNEKVNFCRPAVDVLFQSVVKVYGGATLGVILTGMGSDGLIGSRAIHEQGGHVLAQDRCSSAVWGMPGAVVNAKLASCVLPPRKLAELIVETRENHHCLKR